MIIKYFLFMFLSYFRNNTKIARILPVSWQTKKIIQLKMENLSEILDDHRIINNKLQTVYCKNCKNNFTQYLEENKDFLENKSLIAISPGGYKGFYIMGVAAFIKDNYPHDKFIYSGASAGAWNSLFFTLKKPTETFIEDIIQDENKIRDMNTPQEIETYMKNKILKKYTTQDFDLKRLFVGVTTIENYKRVTNIYTDFLDLEDAIQCCMASSHIPFITGGMTVKYKNKYSFDGGFSTYPYLKILKPALYITPSIFQEDFNSRENNSPLQREKNDPNKEKFSLQDTTTLFSRKNFDLFELYKRGYNDAQKNKDYLNRLLFSKVK